MHELRRAGRSFTHDMNRGAIRHDRELFGFEPCRSAIGSPGLLPGGLDGDGDASGTQILDTHESHIAIADRKEKGARRSERPDSWAKRKRSKAGERRTAFGTRHQTQNPRCALL